MAPKTLLIALSLYLVTVLVTGCSRMSAEEAAIRKDFPSIPEEMPIQNLGEIDLISGIPKNVELKNGQSLAITVTAQTDQTLQVVLEYESFKKSMGSLVKESFSQRSQFLLKPGMRCAPKLGDELAIVFRPRIIDSEKELLL